jgi:hypothetical protein
MSDIIEKIKAIILKAGNWIFDVKAVTPKKTITVACKSKSKSKSKKK